MALSFGQTVCLAWVGAALAADALVAMAIFRALNGRLATVRLVHAMVPGYIEDVYVRSCRESGATPSRLVALRRLTTGNLFLSLVVALPMLLMPPPQDGDADAPPPAAMDHPVGPPATIAPPPVHRSAEPHGQ